MSAQGHTYPEKLPLVQLASILAYPPDNHRHQRFVKVWKKGKYEKTAQFFLYKRLVIHFGIFENEKTIIFLHCCPLFDEIARSVLASKSVMVVLIYLGFNPQY